MSDKQQVHIFWTGGWDSTFRVLELSRMPVIIQPHYIVYSNRRSLEYEQRAIREITEDVLKDPKRQADLRPCLMVKYEDIPADPEMTATFRHLAAYSHAELSSFGPQYEYLARYANTVGEIELSSEWGPGILDEIIDDHGNSEQVDLGNGISYERIIPGGDDPAVHKFFRNLVFPIRELSKVDMKRIAEKEGYTETLYKSWFCHYPANGEACGSCKPCSVVVEQGLIERLSPKAVMRFAIDLRYENNGLYKFYKRVRRKVRGF